MDEKVDELQEQNERLHRRLQQLENKLNQTSSAAQ